MTHKLLLADDSVTIQRVIELTFADEDVEVTTVGDGQLAIERLDADHFDIVLADVDMPKRDGYEVAAYVKSRPKLAHIPVVLLTGAFEPIDQVRADAAGSSDVLAKPFEPQMVINRVKQLLGNKKADGSYESFPTNAGQPGFGPPMPANQQAMAPRPPAHTTPAPQEQAPTGAPAAPVSLDDYFDQLDAAFSNLQSASPVAEPAAGAMDWSMPDTSSEDLPLKTPAPRATLPVVEQARPIAPPAPAPLPPPLPPPVRPVATAPPALTRPVPPPAPVHHPEPVVAPPVAPPPVAQSWHPEPAAAVPARPAPSAPPAPAPRPTAPPPVVAKPAPSLASPNPFASLSAAKAEVAAARAAAPVITEEVIEEVVARVLERLTDRVVRETVTEIVSKTAERAVQEEIERIRNGGE
jgi:CheY-like chemotaxis protein